MPRAPVWWVWLVVSFVSGEGALVVAQSGDGDTLLSPLELSEVQYWAYQIQGVDEPGALETLVDSRYDMIVMEPTRTDWSSDAKFFDAPSAVTRLKNSLAHDGEHRKLVVAYIDIGEAEDWRWYWTWSKEWPAGEPRPDDWPEYILIHDPDG